MSADEFRDGTRSVTSVKIMELVARFLGIKKLGLAAVSVNLDEKVGS